MQSTQNQVQLAPVQDLREAKQDWLNKAYHTPTRDKQLAFAMVDAVLKNPFHELAYSIGRSVKGMK